MQEVAQGTAAGNLRRLSESHILYFPPSAHHSLLRGRP